MTDRDALLAAILSDPNDDTPRLIFADWLEDRGETERSEFIRIQIELARSQAFGPEHKNSLICGCRRCEIKYRNSVLLRSNNGREWRQLPWGSAPRQYLTRGFISVVTLPWAGWLKHHAEVCWSPSQTRPFVPTAQPLETVRFSSFEVVSGECDESEDGRTITAATEKGLFEFRLMQCVNCHGNGVPYQEGIEGHGAYCPVCRGDGNRSLWRCDAWPGVDFVMPEPAYGEPPLRAGYQSYAILQAAREAAGVRRGDAVYLNADGDAQGRPAVHSRDAIGQIIDTETVAG